MRSIFAFQPGYPQPMLPFIQYVRQHDLLAAKAMVQDFAMFDANMEALDEILRSYLDMESRLSPYRVDSLLYYFPQLAHNFYCYAVWAGNLDLLGLMLQRGMTMLYHATEIAAFLGRVKVLTYLEENKLATYSTQTLNWACRQGHFNAVEFLHPHIAMGDTVAMDAAATNGHFEIVKFLHVYRDEGCTTTAMDQAAANGHLEIVKFLHYNRTEGATTKAMTLAASHGHLDVVKFLYEHRSEGCTLRALHGSRESNQQHVEAFLRQPTNQLKLGLDEAYASCILAVLP
ncbi:unnamed protein product [Aphanomyces euteiches]